MYRKQFPQDFPFSSVDECIAEMGGEVSDPGAFCASWYHDTYGRWPTDPKNPDGRTPPGRITTLSKAPGQKAMRLPMDLKLAEADDGSGDMRFTGYGSVYDVVDSDDEVIARGAFTDSLKQWRDAGRLPPLLWQHDWREPIGRYESIEETEEGLKVEGRLFATDIQRSRQAARLIKENAIDGLSIGFIPRPPLTFNEDTGVTYIHRGDLMEISVVTFPANGAARIDGAKESAAVQMSKAQVPAVTTLAEAEAVLRRAGWSRGAATALISQVRDLSRGDPGATNPGDDAGEALRKLTEAMRV